MGIKHTTQTARSNNPDYDVSADAWNENHNIEAGTIVNADVNASAAIAQSKLSLDITNSEINASAAIAYSKLNLTGALLSGDIKDGEIVNADVNASAAISVSKLAFDGGITFTVDAQAISAPNADDDYLVFKARDNGVGLVEVSRVVGAADPYVSFGGSQQIKIFNSGYVSIVGNLDIDDEWGIRTTNNNDDYFTFLARDNGVGRVEVGRVAGAADPYVAFGGSQETKFYYSNAITLGGIATMASGKQLNAAADGVVNFSKAGTISDADFTTDTTGLIGIDTSNDRIYYRIGAADWSYVAADGGFSFPEKACSICDEPFLLGEEISMVIDGFASDGAPHASPIHRSCKN